MHVREALALLGLVGELEGAGFCDCTGGACDVSFYCCTEGGEVNIVDCEMRGLGLRRS